ncbi:MAG: BREX-3 system P-loop-containing protein BrxF [Firmicutes bacterium]|nr:BREX-3 system P-loop-containing protein BrxF [Bacillota bacterium]
MADIGEFKELAASLSSEYYKLLLLVGGSGRGKTSFIRKICSEDTDKYRYINLNRALSEKLKEIPIAERCYYVQDYIDDIVKDNPGDFLVLDNIEIIFSRHLQVEPLRLLKNISKYRKTITAWPGSIKDGYLTYAEPWHKDYVKYSLNDLECLYINLERGMQL